jgi:hypothetical protein
MINTRNPPSLPNITLYKLYFPDPPKSSSTATNNKTSPLEEKTTIKTQRHKHLNRKNHHYTKLEIYRATEKYPSQTVKNNYSFILPKKNKSTHPSPENLNIKITTSYTRQHLPNSTTTISKYRSENNLFKSPIQSLHTSSTPPKMLYKYILRKPTRKYKPNEKLYENLNPSISKYLSTNHVKSKLYLPKTPIKSKDKNNNLPNIHKRTFKRIRRFLPTNQETPFKISKYVSVQTKTNTIVKTENVTTNSLRPPDLNPNPNNKENYTANRKQSIDIQSKSGPQWRNNGSRQPPTSRIKPLTTQHFRQYYFTPSRTRLHTSSLAIITTPASNRNISPTKDSCNAKKSAYLQQYQT